MRLEVCGSGRGLLTYRENKITRKIKTKIDYFLTEYQPPQSIGRERDNFDFCSGMMWLIA
jgi:hypothetical protein